MSIVTSIEIENTTVDNLSGSMTFDNINNATSVYVYNSVMCVDQKYILSTL